MKRALRILGIGLLSLIVLVVGGSAAVYYLVGFDRLVDEAIAQALPSVEEALGRKVRVGAVKTGFFPTLSVEVPQIAVSGAEGEPDLFSASAVEVDVALWKALFSFGKTLEIGDVRVREPRVVVLRRADGSLSIDDLLSAKEKEPAPETEERPAAWPENLRIGRIRIESGALYLVDAEKLGDDGDLRQAALSYVEAIDLGVENLGLRERIAVEVSLAALAPQKNFRLAFQAGPLDSIPPEGIPPLRDLRIEASEFALRSVGAFLGEAGRPLEEARLTAELAIPALVPGEPIRVDGKLAVAGLRMDGGSPVDLRTVIAAGIDLEAGDVEIGSLLVDVGGMRLSGRGAVRSATSLPRVEGLEIRSEAIRLETLLALLPQLRASLPEGSDLRGPLHLEVLGSGDAAAQKLRARVDLGEAEIRVPGALAKPASVPLALSADVDLAQGGATVHEIRFRLSELDLALDGKVESFDPPAFDLKLAAKPFSFDAMVRLSPAIAQSLAETQTSASGQGSVEGHLRGKGSSVDARLSAALLGARLSVPQARVEGDIRLAARFSGDPASAWQAGLDLDAGSARLSVPEWVEKAPQTPLVARVEVQRQGQLVRVPAFDVRLGELRLSAEGSLDLGGGDSALVLTLPRADLARLRATFPAIPERFGSGHLEGSVRVQGDPARPGSLALTIPSFSGRIGASDFAFQGSVRNLDAPEIHASVRSSFLDLDALMGEGEGEKEEREAAPKEDRPELRKIRARADLHLARARFTERDLSNVVATAILEDGVFRLEEARFDLYGGRVSAAGSQAEIWRGKMPYQVRLAVRDVDVGAAIAGETGKASPLAGRGNVDVELAGTGTDREDFERNLRGAWTLSMKEGRVTGPDLSGTAIRSLSAVPALAGRSIPSERNLRDLFGRFVVENGQMNLEQPMRLELGQAELELGGAVGIFGDLRLQGRTRLPPALLASISGGRCRPDAPVEVPISIFGPPSSPSVRADGEAVAIALAKTCLAGEVEDAVEKLVGEEKVQKARELEQTARREAEEAAARARAEAEKQKRELERQAQQAKKEAEKKAQQKTQDAAKKARDEVKKRLGF